MRKTGSCPAAKTSNRPGPLSGTGSAKFFISRSNFKRRLSSLDPYTFITWTDNIFFTNLVCPISYIWSKLVCMILSISPLHIYSLSWIVWDFFAQLLIGQYDIVLPLWLGIHIDNVLYMSVEHYIYRLKFQVWIWVEQAGDLVTFDDRFFLTLTHLSLHKYHLSFMTS